MANILKGIVLDIHRFSVHDGPGIRTTVFLKGCPLSCIWCHNPESMGFDPELYYNENQCVSCGRCVETCPIGCHTIIDGKHHLDRTKCNGCFACTNVCYYGALKKKGDLMSPNEITKIVLRDNDYFVRSGGGVTVSGGEPTSQPAFLESLLQNLKDAGIHVCLDTCGYCDSGYIEKISGLVDIFLYDFKLGDSKQHMNFTGVNNEIILKNLEILNVLNRPVILRCPIIPGINDNEKHLTDIAAICARLDNIYEVDIMPYHSSAGSKWTLYGKEYTLKNLAALSDMEVQSLICKLQAIVRVPVVKG